jgi:hypothetical protein
MNKEFIPYEQALALKELGFDEPCFGYYIESGIWMPAPYSKEGHMLPKNTDLLPEWCSAPTFSQAFRWFREKYKLQSYIDFYHSESYFFKIKSQDGKHIGNTGDTILQGSPVFTRPYEEAELACLIKLIEIVKEKK